MAEFEKAISTIIRWLAEHGDSWDTQFRIDTILDISPTMFAMLCAAGWIANWFFPKGSFIIAAQTVNIIEHGRQRK